MTTIEIKVPQSFVERGIMYMREEVEAIEEAMEILEENHLEKTDGYWDLQAKKCDLEEGIEHLEEQLDEDSEPGMGELFE